VNDDAVEPIDPLFLHPSALFNGASQFAEELVYEISAGLENPRTTGIVRVRFSELPVAEWSRLSNSEKRERGIAKGARVCRWYGVPANGWFFLGGKRRENYDDWWRCEIQFDPVLDEAFGITHTKQQIRPSPYLLEALSPDMESIARALNARARKAHFTVKVAERFSTSEDRASKKDEMLTPLPPRLRPRDEHVLRALGTKLTPSPVNADRAAPSNEYRIVPTPLSETAFFNTRATGAGWSS